MKYKIITKYRTLGTKHSIMRENKIKNSLQNIVMLIFKIILFTQLLQSFIDAYN